MSANGMKPMPASTTAQRGLSLIELMIAMVLGLLVLGAVIQIFLGSSQAYRMNEALARNQENARYAIEVLAHDIRMAGNMGCQSRLKRESPDGEGNLARGTFRVALDDPGSYAWSFQDGIQGHHWTGSSSWSPALPAEIASVIDNSDVITLRGSRYLGLVVEAHPGGTPPGSANLQVAASNGLSQGDILIVGDCTSAAIFQINGANPATSGSIAHNEGAAGGPPGNRTNALGRSFEGADVMQLSTVTYFLRNNPAGQPALYRRVNNQPVEELVAGIERMRFEYGVDPTGTVASQVEDFQFANAVADWGEVLSVRINLLMVSAENNITTEVGSLEFAGETIDLTDRRLRQVVTSTVALRNRLQ